MDDVTGEHTDEFRLTDEQMERFGEFIAKRIYRRPAERRLYPDLYAGELAAEIVAYFNEEVPDAEEGDVAGRAE